MNLFKLTFSALLLCVSAVGCNGETDSKPETSSNDGVEVNVQTDSLTAELDAAGDSVEIRINDLKTSLKNLNSQ